MLFTVPQNWLYFRFKSTKFDFAWGCVPDSAGDLNYSAHRPLAVRRRRKEAASLAPTFQTSRLSGFWASLHILSHHLACICLSCCTGQ